jgi:hypothetical protein
MLNQPIHVETINDHLLDDNFSNANGQGFKKLWKGVKKYNPIGVTARSGTLAAANVNLFGMSTRMYPAFATEAEIKKYRLKKTSVGKAKKAWEKVSAKWTKFGGDPAKLKKAMAKGWRRKIKRLDKNGKFSGFVGRSVDYGDPFDLGFSYIGGGQKNNPNNKNRISERYSGVAGEGVVLITAALPVIAALIKEMKDSGTDANPYEDGANPELENDLKTGGDNAPAPDPTTEKDIQDNSGTVKDGEDGVNSDGQEDKIAGIPKTAFWIGVSVVGLLAIWGAVSWINNGSEAAAPAPKIA